jgi:hypothetical protein
MSTKPRSDSRLASLNPQQKAQLRTWLVDENLAYEKVVELLRDDFNIRTSTGALSRFYATECFRLRSSEAKTFAEQCVQELRDSGEKFDEATLALVKQKAFERAYARNGNLDELATLAKIIGDSAKLELKKRDQELTERRIQILEQKAKQADQAQKITGNPKLSDEEKAARMRSLFGLG